jgi:hypothetical protein
MSTADAVTPSATPAPSSTAAAMTAAPATPAAVAAPGGAAPVSTESVNPGAWMAGFNDDLKGYVGNKGFKDPAALADAYRNLEKLQGVPQDRLMKLPESLLDANGALTAEGRAVFERIGAPKDSKEYGLVAAEGGDPKRLEIMTKAMFDMGLTKAQATKLAAMDGEYIGGVQAAQKEMAAATFRDQDASLRKEWGAAFDQNRNVAADAMRKMGWDAKKVDALASVMGHADTMKMLNQMGKSFGEAAYVGGKAAAGPMEPSTAKSKITELMGDKDFGARLMNGDSEAKATWARLHEQAYQGTVNL